MDPVLRDGWALPCGPLVLAQVAFLEKDVPVPYVSAVTSDSAPGDPSEEWGRRPYLIFFRGHVSRKKNVSGPRGDTMQATGSPAGYRLTIDPTF